MKLLNKTSIIYLIAIIPIFVLCSSIFLIVAKKINQHHVDESLIYDKEEIIEKTKTSHPQHIESNLTEDYVIEELESTTRVVDRVFSENLFDEKEQDYKEYRVLVAVLKHEGHRYRIRLERPLIANITLIYSLGISLVLIAFLSVIALFFINHYFSLKLWSPFYHILEDIKTFESSKKTYLL